MRYYVQTEGHGEAVFLRLKMKRIRVILTLSQLSFVLGGRLFWAAVVWMLGRPFWSSAQLHPRGVLGFTVVQLVPTPSSGETSRESTF